LEQIADVVVSPSIYLKLISREIILAVFQPLWSRYLNVTDGPTDRRTDDIYYGITAFCVAWRGKNYSSSVALCFPPTHTLAIYLLSVTVRRHFYTSSLIQIVNNFHLLNVH